METRPGFFRWIENDIELQIHAKPGAKRTEVVGLHGGALKVSLKARAIEGAANAALLEFLADEFEVARARCVLIGGDRSRQKRVRIERPPRERADQVLQKWCYTDKATAASGSPPSLSRLPWSK